MQIQNKLKKAVGTNTEVIMVNPKRKIDGFIWGLLLGMILEIGILYSIVRPYAPSLWWAFQHPAEVKWAKERYETIQKASHVLYFEDQMTGVTIVKPQISTFKGE